MIREYVLVPQAYRVLFVACALCIVLALFVYFWPVGPDWYYTFRPVTLAFLQGETQLFDEASQGFYLAPWGVFLLAPLAMLSIELGQAILCVITLLSLLLAVKVINDGYSPDILVICLAVMNLHTLAALLRGNMEGFLLLGLALGWWGLQERKPLALGAGLWLLSVKPVNVTLPALLLLWGIRKWGHKEKALVAMPLALTVLLSFVVFGLDWPLRYIESLRIAPPLVYLQTTVWRLLEVLKAPEWVRTVAVFPAATAVGAALAAITLEKPSVHTFALAQAVNLAVTPYALGGHYVLLAASFVTLGVTVCAQNKKTMLAMWTLTLLPLARLWLGWNVAPIAALYPMAMVALLLSGKEQV